MSSASLFLHLKLDSWTALCTLDHRRIAFPAKELPCRGVKNYKSECAMVVVECLDSFSIKSSDDLRSRS